RRRGVAQNIPWRDWEEALEGLSNSAIADYYKSQLQRGRESYLRDRSLMYRIEGKRRWFLSARDNRAYCWQEGRFQGDIDFWSKRLTDANSVKAVKRGTALRFLVSTANDFAAFDAAVSQELLGVEWTQEPVIAAMSTTATS